MTDTWPDQFVGQEYFQDAKERIRRVDAKFDVHFRNGDLGEHGPQSFTGNGAQVPSATLAGDTGEERPMVDAGK